MNLKYQQPIVTMFQQLAMWKRLFVVAFSDKIMNFLSNWYLLILGGDFKDFGIFVPLKGWETTGNDPL